MNFTTLRRRFSGSWEELRSRMIAETSAFLTFCLQHPELTIRIPVIPAGSGRFPTSMAEAFWGPILGESATLPLAGG